MSAYRAMEAVSMVASEWVAALVAEYNKRPDVNHHEDQQTLAMDLDLLLTRHKPQCSKCGKQVDKISVVAGPWAPQVHIRAICHGDVVERVISNRALQIAIGQGHYALVELVWSPYF